MGDMKISELASRTGLPPSTLRYYEAEGLLPAEREANGYRKYDESAVDRLAFIIWAKSLDLPLADIRELVTAWESEPCSQVRAVYRPILRRRTAQVDQRVAALDSLHDTLVQALVHLDSLPERDAPCDAGCAVLEPTTPPIVCTLASNSHVADRIATWHQLLEDSRPVLAGTCVRVTLPIDRLAQIAALAAAEQRCCSFFDFRLDLHGPSFDLTVTAPAEAIDLVEELLPPAARNADQ